MNGRKKASETLSGDKKKLCKTKTVIPPSPQPVFQLSHLFKHENQLNQQVPAYKKTLFLSMGLHFIGLITQ